MIKNVMGILVLKIIVTKIKIHYMGSTSDLRYQKKETVNLKLIEITQSE